MIRYNNNEQVTFTTLHSWVQINQSLKLVHKLLHSVGTGVVSLLDVQRVCLMCQTASRARRSTHIDQFRLNL